MKLCISCSMKPGVFLHVKKLVFNLKKKKTSCLTITRSDKATLPMKARVSVMTLHMLVWAVSVPKYVSEDTQWSCQDKVSTLYLKVE